MCYFKGRFCSLRGLCQQIDDSVDHQRALAWIKACIVIHTLVGLIEHDKEDPEFVDELVLAGLSNQEVDGGFCDGESGGTQGIHGQQKPTSLKISLLEALVVEE